MLLLFSEKIALRGLVWFYHSSKDSVFIIGSINCNFFINSGNLVASSGEDGQVFVWDPRTGREPRHKVAPHTHDQLARPHLGRFIASLDLYNDWLVRGNLYILLPVNYFSYCTLFPYFRLCVCISLKLYFALP